MKLNFALLTLLHIATITYKEKCQLNANSLTGKAMPYP